MIDDGLSHRPRSGLKKLTLTIIFSQMYAKPESLLRFKIVLLGNHSVGKTSLITRKTRPQHSGAPSPTTGGHCTELPFLVDGKQASLQVWDTAGQEHYRSLVPVYLRGAHAAILMFDVSDANSFTSLVRWYEMMGDVLAQPVPVFLVANKIDLKDKVTVDDEAAAKFAKERRAKFAKISALNGDGVEQLFTDIISELTKTNLSNEVESPNVGATDQSKKCLC
jgi:small GTP-binding protein